MVGLRRDLVAGFVAVAIGLVAAAFGSAASPRTTRLVVYALPKTAEFINHADDRIRGMSVNPFTPDEQALVILSGGKEKGNGPFPGDDVLYTYALYTGNDLKSQAGLAMYTCYYGFLKRATCDAYYQLSGGLLLGEGEIVFNSRRYDLAVTGGSGAYLAEGGSVSAAPAAGLVRLDFVLEGPR